MAKTEKTTSPSTALVQAGGYFPLVKTQDEVGDAITIFKENLGGQTITPFDLPRIKIPSGRSTNWMLLEPTGEEVNLPSVRGVIIHHQLMRSYWKESFDQSGGGSPPDCWSPDSKHGIGDPGIECVNCEYAEFGSDPKGGIGQACKQMDMLFVLREGMLLPSIIAITPGSLSNWKKILLSLLTAAKPLPSLVFEFSLVTTKNKKGIDYPKVAPRVVYEMSDAEKRQIVNYVSSIKPLISQVDLTKVASDFARGEEVEA